ncbi:expressed protein, partial [Aureococcus anophagefferens]
MPCTIVIDDDDGQPRAGHVAHRARAAAGHGRRREQVHAALQRAGGAHAMDGEIPARHHLERLLRGRGRRLARRRQRLRLLDGERDAGDRGPGPRPALRRPRLRVAPREHVVQAHDRRPERRGRGGRLRGAAQRHGPLRRVHGLQRRVLRAADGPARARRLRRGLRRRQRVVLPVPLDERDERQRVDLLRPLCPRAGVHARHRAHEQRVGAPRERDDPGAAHVAARDRLRVLRRLSSRLLGEPDPQGRLRLARDGGPRRHGRVLRRAQRVGDLRLRLARGPQGVLPLVVRGRRGLLRGAVRDHELLHGRRLRGHAERGPRGPPRPEPELPARQARGG